MFWSLLIMTIIAVAGGASMGIEQVEDGINAWEDAVKKSVEDDAKKDEAVAFVEDVRKQMAERRAKLGDALSKYLKIEAKYGATTDEVDSAIETLNAIWTEQERWLIDKRFELKEMLTDKEWEAALTYVDKELQGHWDKLKESQKKAREQYEKLLKKSEQ